MLKISPAEALLILIDAYQTDPLPQGLEGPVPQFKSWYLSGFELGQYHEPLMPNEFRLFLKYHPSVKDCWVSFEPHVINADASRRFFETQLAYEVLKSNLDALPMDVLDRHLSALFQIIKALPEKNQQEVLDIFMGSVDRAPKRDQEYAYFIDLLTRKQHLLNMDLPAEAYEKITKLIQCSFLGLFNARHAARPIDIYDTPYFTTERGRVPKAGQTHVRSSHLGIMQAHMPLPRDAVAAKDHTPNHLRTTEMYRYRRGAGEVDRQFGRAVHPFITALSGTLLCQLKNIEYFRQVKKGPGMGEDVELFKTYCQLFIASLVLGLGGHSLYEYFRIFELPEVAAELPGIPDLRKHMTLENLFGGAPLQAALDKTIVYHKQLLQKRMLNWELAISRSTQHFFAPQRAAASADSEAVVHEAIELV